MGICDRRTVLSCNLFSGTRHTRLCFFQVIASVSNAMTVMFND